MDHEKKFRLYFLKPIPEIAEAARILDEGVSAHMRREQEVAERSIRAADMPIIRDWLESVWGANSPHVCPREVVGAIPLLPKLERMTMRMPSSAEKSHLLRRDGFHCRFCAMPVIRSEVRRKLVTWYPNALQWGRRNIDRHAAFQALWLQYDHLVPHSRGGNNDPENMVITCAACNYGRGNFLLEEVGLVDPRLREPVPSTWDGLERILVTRNP